MVNGLVVVHVLNGDEERLSEDAANVSEEGGTKAAIKRGEAVPISAEVLSPGELRRMLEEGEEVTHALQLVIHQPRRFANHDIEDMVLQLWREGSETGVRFDALKAYMRMHNSMRRSEGETLSIAKEALDEDEPLLRLLGARAVLAFEDGRRGVEMVVPLALKIEERRVRQKSWSLVSSYLRREEAFLPERRWPGIGDSEELLGLLEAELSNPEMFWEENDIRKNLRDIYLAARLYFVENMGPVSVDELVESGHLSEVPDSVAGEKYSAIVIKNGDHAFWISVTTSDGRRISVR